MALLLYCVADRSASYPTMIGVSGSPVVRLEHSEVTLFYSEEADSNRWLRAPLKKSAEEFHGVQQELFRTAAIIPFRFPTILGDQEKLREHLHQRSAEYKSLLCRFRTSVQMDIMVTDSMPPADRPSGAQYLRDRQIRHRRLEQFAADIRQRANGVVEDWRQRSLANGLRCFALVERERVPHFNETMKTVVVPAGLKARISGPWPMAEFLEFSA
jgi:Gas vesicle synthesis protein GvpL/GvpF